MNRRGHLSHKVPNVKLRPAPAGRSTRRSAAAEYEPEPSPWSDQEDEAGPSLTTGAKPWKEITVTFTGVDEKPKLSAYVKELGGQVENALTVNVTHVIACEPGSAKYMYAIEHRLPVLSPSWVQDSHARWMAGQDLDVPASVETHRLQPFTGLKISISGIDQLDHRKTIIRYIQQSGGTYSKDLDRTCTHLVSAFPTSDPKAKASEKIKWALKEIGDRAMARRKGRKVEGSDIWIIYEQWIWDCVAFRGRWKEEGYDARKPRSRGKVKMEAVLDGSCFEPPPEPEKEEKEDDKPAVLRKKRIQEDMGSLVDDLLSTTGIPKQEEDRAGSAAAEEPVTKLKLDSVAPKPRSFERKPSLLHVSKSTSFAVSAEAGPSRSFAAPEPEIDRSTSRPPQFFSAMRFTHVIAEGCQGLENALKQHGGTIVSESEWRAGALVDYVIVRLSSRTKVDMPPVQPGEPTPALVTECWVEGCCFEQRLLDPNATLVFRPLSVHCPIPGASDLLVHISGFPTETTVYLKRLLKTVGGVQSEKLNRRTTHLVCAAPEGQKWTKAHEWGVTCVKDSWMWNMGRAGVIDDVSLHLHATEMGPGAPLSGKTTLKSGASEADAAPGSPVPPANLTVDELSASSLSSRALKSTPTHIDKTLGNSRTTAGHDSTNALQSPKASTERLLNRARTVTDPTSSPGRKGGGTHSLNGIPVPTGAGGVVGTVSSPSALGGDVTAALRRLAEEDVPPTRSKVLRRARNSRPRSEVSGPSPLSPQPREIASPSSTAAMEPDVPHAHAQQQVQEESMRVTYADGASEKERKRLLEAVMKGAPSPKRPRV